MFEKNYMAMIGEVKSGEKHPKKGTAVSSPDPYYALASVVLQQIIQEESVKLNSEKMDITENYVLKLRKHMKKIKTTYLQELSDLDH